jgi:hypothetical protein
MSLLMIAHGLTVICYLVLAYLIRRGWKNNQLERQFNAALYESAIALAKEVQVHVDKNEKLVAEAKGHVERAMAAVDRSGGPGVPGDVLMNPDGSIALDKDPAMLCSMLTAIVVKYGDMRLGIEDMASLVDGEDYISVYVDTKTEEVVLSTKHNLEDKVSFLNYTNPSDDETYH